MSKPATKLCKYCKSEIPYDAKVCPQCRKKVKGGFFKWVLIVVAALILIAAFSGGNGEKNQETKKIGNVSTNSTTNSEASAETEPEKTIYNVGDILQDGNTKIVYAASGDFVSDNPFLQPADGNKYIFLKFAFENVSDKSDTSISSFSFECYADGYQAKEFYGGDENLQAVLSPGRTTMGFVYFEIPKDAENVEVEYETNVFTDKKIKFLFEGDIDSGYVPEINTKATPGAVHVGEVIEVNKTKWTYLSCEEYKSTNMFVTPKDGYHFVSCEFEIENTGSSDVSVSALSFDCYADGAACEQTYIRDDDLSGSISSGRKIKGTVTFEVPNNATVVEAEYLENVWTSSRIVFTIQ